MYDWLLLFACVDIDLDICTMIIYPSKYSFDLIHLIFVLDIIPEHIWVFCDFVNIEGS